MARRHDHDAGGDADLLALKAYDLAGTPRKASSIKGTSRSARTVSLDELAPVDLVLTGCVAVDESGAIDWTVLTDDKIASIPFLAALAAERGRR